MKAQLKQIHELIRSKTVWRVGSGLLITVFFFFCCSILLMDWLGWLSIEAELMDDFSIHEMLGLALVISTIITLAVMFIAFHLLIWPLLATLQEIEQRSQRDKSALSAFTTDDVVAKFIALRQHMQSIAHQGIATVDDESDTAQLTTFAAEQTTAVMRVDSQLTILTANSAALGLLERWQIAVGSRLPVEWLALIEAALQDGQHHSVEIDYHGGTYYTHALGLIEQSCVNIYIVDVTQRKQAEAEIKFLIERDYVTGLPNRNKFKKTLTEKIKDITNVEQEIALFIFNIIDFKKINAAIGSIAGDQLLREVSARLKKTLPTGIEVARLHGNDFAFYMIDTDLAQRQSAIAQQVLACITEQIYLVAHQRLKLSITIGVVAKPIPEASSASDLLQCADLALYKARVAGINRYYVYCTGMHEEAELQRTMIVELSYALERQQLSLVYQPQFAIDSQKIIGCEALIRWHHPEFGAVSPANFIPIAESSGLIVPIGDWVLRTACEQNLKWYQAGLCQIPVSVNLSPVQFLQADIVAEISQVLRSTGLPAELLKLEITESTVMQQTDKACQRLQALRDMGVQLAIDDFGTGYSSLSYLSHFPVDTIKIDQSFIRNIDSNRGNSAIVKAVIDLGHDLNLNVIAEGVATEAELNQLIGYRCDDVQGYFFSKPLTNAKLAELLAHSIV